jgi:hypothetical protein
MCPSVKLWNLVVHLVILNYLYTVPMRLSLFPWHGFLCLFIFLGLALFPCHDLLCFIASAHLCSRELQNDILFLWLVGFVRVSRDLSSWLCFCLCSCFLWLYTMKWSSLRLELLLLFIYFCKGNLVVQLWLAIRSICHGRCMGDSAAAGSINSSPYIVAFLSSFSSIIHIVHLKI